MKTKQFSQSFACLFFLMIGQIGGVVSAFGGASAAEAFPEEGGRPQQYRVPTLNGKPIVGIGEETDCVFLVQLRCGDDPMEIGIEGNNIILGNREVNTHVDGETINFKDCVRGIVQDTAEDMRALRRLGNEKVEGSGNFLSHRSHRTRVVDDTVTTEAPTMVDVTYGLAIQGNTLDFGQPLVIGCQQDPSLRVEQEGKQTILRLPKLEKNTVASSFIPGSGDFCVRDGVVLMPNSGGGKGTWLKGIIVRTDPDFVAQPLTAVIGKLNFFPPLTESPIDGLCFFGAHTLALVVGPPDATWEYVDVSSPLAVRSDGGVLSVRYAQGPEESYYRLSVPGR